MLKRFATLVFIFLLSATAASAQETSSGFSAQGRAVAQLLISGMGLNMGADISLFSRGQQFRVDFSHLSAPGTNPLINALVQQFMPQGSFTIVLDRAAKTATLWSADKRLYYVNSTSRSAGTSGNETPSSVATGVIADAQVGTVVQFLKSVKDYSIYEMSARLSGRGTANGHPVTIVQYSLRTQKRGGPLSAMSGEVDLADDEQGLPVRLTSAIQGKNIKGSFRFDFSQVSAVAPNPSSFAVPAGYTQTNDPAQILGMPGLSAPPH